MRIRRVPTCSLESLGCAPRSAMTRFTVEPLPSRPSLEHQQKLAKRLLRDCWAGDADAIARVRAFLPGSPNLDALKLHDAQLVIARGYGFASWAAMKRKIESLTKSPLEQFDIAVREGDAELAARLCCILPPRAPSRSYFSTAERMCRLVILTMPRLRFSI